MWDIERQTCRCHLAIESPWGDLRITVSFMILRGFGILVRIGQQTWGDGLGIDGTSQLKTRVQSGDPKDGEKATVELEALAAASQAIARKTDNGQGLHDLRHLQIAHKLEHFFCAGSWMRKALPRMADFCNLFKHVENRFEEN